jgi:N-acetylmuramoyl-L-alanine amidase
MNIYVSPSVQDWNKGVDGYGTEEKRMNELADYVVPLLQHNGFTVYRNKPSMSLNEVVKDSNKHAGTNGIHLALHSNAGGGSGAEIYYYSGSYAGQKLAEDIYNEVSKLTPFKDRGVKHNTSFLELNGTKGIAVLLESVFHDHKEDVKWIKANMEPLAKAIVKGVCKHTGTPFVTPIAKAKPTPKVFYRVVAGSFTSYENAEKQKRLLKDRGFKSFIDTYKE